MRTSYNHPMPMPLASHQGAFPAKQASASALMNQSAVERDGDEPGRERRGQSEGQICHFNNAKAELRNSWRETAVKMERFFDPESKSADPAREIIKFLTMCQLCPIFTAVCLLEFLSSVSAL